MNYKSTYSAFASRLAIYLSNWASKSEEVIGFLATFFATGFLALTAALATGAFFGAAALAFGAAARGLPL
jgi:hypothetical protein